jgi:hypothetical protein
LEGRERSSGLGFGSFFFEFGCLFCVSVDLPVFGFITSCCISPLYVIKLPNDFLSHFLSSFLLFSSFPLFFTKPLDTLVKQMGEFAEERKSSREFIREVSATLGDLVNKIADIQIQLADVRTEKDENAEQMKALSKRLMDLENKPRDNPAPVNANANTYASVASLNLPPAPIAQHKPAPVQPKEIKPLRSEYPRAEPEVLVSFQNTPLSDTSMKAVDNALNAVNHAMIMSKLAKPIFFGAHFSMLDNLVLTTALHSSNEGLDEYFETIEKAVSYIAPGTGRCLAIWTKFLLHGVPTHLDVESIRQQVKGYSAGVSLGQTPRWLAPPEARSNKTHSTIVLAFVGEVNFTNLGGRSIMVGNRMCNLITYTAFGLQTQCSNCEAFGYPNAFCQTGPKSAVCAQDHETSQHPCEID